MVQKKWCEKKIGCSTFEMLWLDPLWHECIRECSTVKPQGYGLHSYGKSKISIKWERVIKFSSVAQALASI